MNYFFQSLIFPSSPIETQYDLKKVNNNSWKYQNAVLLAKILRLNNLTAI
jgi:hypothetical protein